MTIRDMHYDFKMKLNKLDSQQNRNLKVPEIDWVLNEAREVFVKAIAEPRLRNGLGFEIGQRTTDDIRSIVVDQNMTDGTCIRVTRLNDETYIATLPQNYMYYIGAKLWASKDTCPSDWMTVKVKQHNDEHEQSPFDRSSWLWREANIEFFSGGIKIFTSGDFIPTYLCLSYLKTPLYMQNAQDYPGGTYTMPDNVTVYTGSQDCDLPPQVHRQIVDLAVLITTGVIQGPDYQVKQMKFKLSE